MRWFLVVVILLIPMSVFAQMRCGVAWSPSASETDTPGVVAGYNVYVSDTVNGVETSTSPSTVITARDPATAEKYVVLCDAIPLAVGQYVAVRVVDKDGGVSGLSNIARRIDLHTVIIEFRYTIEP